MRDNKNPKALVPVIIGVVVALSVVTGVVWSKKMDDKPTKQTTTTQDQTASEETNSNLVAYDGVEGKNALELLKAQEDVVTKQSSFGEYVDSVNGVVGGTDGKYWAFYINGQLSQVGAADYQTKTGDKIEWKFE